MCCISSSLWWACWSKLSKPAWGLKTPKMHNGDLLEPVFITLWENMLRKSVDLEKRKRSHLHGGNARTVIFWITLVQYITSSALTKCKQTNMEGRPSGTYLRLTRASSGPRVSIAKTYRDENEMKINISAQTQRPSSAVECKKLKWNF